MINIIINGPEGTPLRNPIWELRGDIDYAFVDLLREVCKRQDVDPRKYKIVFAGQHMPGGELCLNHLSRGDVVDILKSNSDM